MESRFDGFVGCDFFWNKMRKREFLFGARGKRTGGRARRAPLLVPVGPARMNLIITITPRCFAKQRNKTQQNYKLH
jgi:hypothetical protein